MIVHSSASDIVTDQWKQLVERSPTASFFQTAECYNFYASLSFMKAFVFGVSEDGKLVGLICGYLIADGNVLKRYFSRRAIVPGGLLLDPKISDAALQELLKRAVKELKKQAIYIEIRNYNDYSSFRHSIEASGFSYQAHLNFQVSTPDVETALKQLSTTKRRDIKLSGKEGAEWNETTDLAEVKVYYDLLQHLYKTKIKTPLFPIEFFEHLVKLSQGKIFVVKHQGNIIGGSVCVLLPNQSVYEWFVCGLDGQSKNIFPSTLATWAAIEYAAKNGFTHFDMMGAGKPDEGYGVRDFKARFGGELVENGRFLYILNTILYKTGKFAIKIIKKHT